MAGLPSPTHPPLADEKDAYIFWLKSEFAAANAIIDSLCLHVCSIGSLGEYDAVFSCLNRRRLPWTATIYMQQHLTVAEVVNSLQEVTQKKLQACCPSKVPNVQTRACHDDRQTNSNESITEMPFFQSHGSVNSTPCGKSPLESNSVHSGVAIANSPQEAGDGKLASQSSFNTSAGLSGYSVPPLAIRTASEEPETTSNTSFSDNAEQNNTTKKASVPESEGFDMDRFLKTEVAFATNEEEDRRAIIKNSVLFHCCELLDGKMVNDGESGELYENVFSNKEVYEIIELISQLQAEGRQGSLGYIFSSSEKSENKPDTIQFGRNLNEGVKLDNHLFVPKFLQSMIDWLVSCGILPAEKTPDSCLISIFNKGHFTSPSTSQGAWEKPVCFISLLGPTNMVFGHSIASDERGNCKGPFEITLPAGSVLLLEENFAGIFQKAVPAAPTKRIVLTLGKASTSHRKGLTHMNTEAKCRQEGGAQAACYPGSLKQEMLGGGFSMHEPWRAMPTYLNVPPNGPPLQPVFLFPNSVHPDSYYGSTLCQGWPHWPPLLQNNSSLGTGVFLPSIWPSRLLMSVTADGLGKCRLGNPKRTEKRLKIKGSFDAAMIQKQGRTSSVLDGAMSTST